MNTEFVTDPRLLRVTAAQPWPLLFATISGAHLYGFPSPDSDFDLRGAHVLPLAKVLGLDAPEETVEDSRVIDGLEMDIVSHDVRKFFLMLLKPNGYVLEQVLSPLVVCSTPAHAALKELAARCVTKNHAMHYLGFARGQQKLWLSENPRRVKPLLYLYRVLLTGIHLMRTGEVEANLEILNEEFRLPQIPDLLALKRSGPERGTLSDGEAAFHEAEHARLSVLLLEAHAQSSLREEIDPETRAALNDLLVRVRMDSTTLEPLL